VARQLLALGFDAAALQGGYQAWRATYPVEAKGRPIGARPEARGGDGVNAHEVAPAQERRATRDPSHDLE